ERLSSVEDVLRQTIPVVRCRGRVRVRLGQEARGSVTTYPKPRWAGRRGEVGGAVWSRAIDRVGSGDTVRCPCRSDATSELGWTQRQPKSGRSACQAVVGNGRASVCDL